MAVVLDAVPTSPTYNSYVSVADADIYNASNLYGEAWADADPDVKIKALITATRLLDETFRWAGYQTANTQPLGWPRSGVYYRNGWTIIPNGTIPTALKNATAEYARLLITAQTLPNAESENPAGLKKIKAGSVELEFDPSLASGEEDVVPSLVWAMLDFLTDSISRSRVNVPLYRV